MQNRKSPKAPENNPQRKAISPLFHWNMSSQPPFESLARLLECLLTYYRTSGSAQAESGSLSEQALIYGTTLLRRRRLRREGWRIPTQLVVIGPTQSGKSTLVNLLLGIEAAEASPLAGHTRYPQGFTASGKGAVIQEELTKLLPGWTPVPTGPNDQNRANIFSLSDLGNCETRLSGRSTIWDSPDFDSVNSREYRDMVPVICAMADILILAVSREKYADQSVWRLLNLIAPVGAPLIICLNKTSGPEAEQLLASMSDRLEQASIPYTALLTLPYVADGQQMLWETGEAEVIKARISGLLDHAGFEVGDRRLASLLNRHWSEWIQPVRREHAAAGKWETLVDEELGQFMELYRLDYLNNPDYADTMQRTIVQLLELLEIPGIAGALIQMRKVLTWPARKAHNVYRKKFPEKKPGGKAHEVKVIEEGSTHLLARLRQQISGQITGEPRVTIAWWSNLDLRLKQDCDDIEAALLNEMNTYQTEFDEEIKRAGRLLFEHLKQHPLTLNGLRAARTTTDAAALLLAIKTGGIGLNDLLLAPAMLSFSSLLAEGAVGQYMTQIENDLKKSQLTAVTERLAYGILRKRLLELPALMSQEGCCAVSTQWLADAENQLAALQGA